MIATKVARVLLDGSSELVFDYAIPVGMNLQEGCRVMVPLRKKSSSATVLAVLENETQDFALRELERLIDPEPLITPVLLRMAKWISQYYFCGMESVIRSVLPESVRGEEHGAKMKRIARAQLPWDEAAIERIQKRAPRQWVILSLLQAATDNELPVSELGENVSAVLKALEKANLIRIDEIEERRDPGTNALEEFVPSQPLKLNPEQEIALEKITLSLDSPDPPKPILLLGVTGSGKTEVYLQAAQKALDQGKSVLVLVPEISLTPQTVRRFKSRFAIVQDQVAVLHSNLSQGERFDEWHRIRSGEARIVIGARSAVFAPMKNLGLIIVDEEHENSYKQEVVPRYHGRDVSVLRGAFEPCLVLLGSATPSLESWKNVQQGKYELLRMDQRADAQSMPLVRVIDMKLEAEKQKGGPMILSDRLRAAMEDRLAKGEQMILFLNRRGFARSLQCYVCAEVCYCLHCAVPLTYHRTDERLVCHVCGFQSVVPKKCPKCNDPGITLQGYGTQKVEEVLAKVFPLAKLARIDADTMRRKNALRDTLHAFRTHKVDILIGTQMIAKGLHFPNVTLVGILNADLGLHVPDFRAGERTFQLLTQVAGRAGRGELKGEVVIQTFTPHSPSIQYARKHDFDGYAEQEMEFRRQFAYPPFGHCAVLTSRSTHERRAEFTLQTLRTRLLEEIPPGLEIGEVLPSPLIRSHGQFRFQITLKARNSRALTNHVQAVLKKTSLPEDVIVVFDMDALNFS